MALGETARLLGSLELKDQWTPTVGKAIRSTDQLERRMNRIGGHVSRGIGNVTKNIERLAVVGIGGATAAMTYSIAKAIDWESAVAGVNKTLDATPEELQQITDGIREMSRRLPTSAVELAGIAEAAGALGIRKADILAFTETVSLIGTTTDVSVDQAATALGQLGNVLKLRGDDYDNFASTLVELGNTGASTESQILEITRRAGASANLVGVASDATLGWSSAVANLGINSELGGTALQNFFLKSMPLFTQGNKTLQKITGQTAEQLKRSFQKDASGALEDFLVDLGKMPKDRRLKAVQQLFGKGSGLTRVILGLSDSVSGNLAPALDTATDSWKENVAAAEEAEKRYKTTESQLAILKNNVDDAAVTIGSELLPIINELGSELVGWLQNNQGAVKQFGRDLASGIRDAVQWARSLDWDSIKGGLKAAAGFAKGLVDAFLRMPPEVQGTIIALAGLNKLSGGAIGAIVSELGRGLIKGVLGITAAVVNINAATVNGGGSGSSPSASPSVGGLGPLSGIAGQAVKGLPVLSSLIELKPNWAEKATAMGININGKTEKEIIEAIAKTRAETGFSLESIESETKHVATATTKAGTQTRTALGLITTGQKTQTERIAGKLKDDQVISAVRSGAQSTRGAVLATKAAVDRKKLQVKVNQNQRQTVTAIATANTSGAKAAGGADDTVVRRTSSQLQNIDRYLASGAVGIANQPIRAVFGEAGREAFAILRNPRPGLLGGGEPVVHVTVNIDPRRVTKKQTSSGIYKTFVAT